METVEEQPDALEMSTLLWYAIFVWFASSLFSQSVYMAFNGVPSVSYTHLTLPTILLV